jgi:hypothetical protein
MAGRASLAFGWLLVGLAVACSEGASEGDTVSIGSASISNDSISSASPSAATPVGSAIATTASASAPPLPAPPPPCETEIALSFGRLVVPRGHCARRVGEGDDMTSVLSDETGFPYARVAHLAHGAKIGDACAPAKRKEPERVGGRPATRCKVESERLCIAFGPSASICSTSPKQNPHLERAVPGFAFR